MADWESLSHGFWEALAVSDVGPAQAEAERDFRLAIIGAPGSGKTTLNCTLAGKLPEDRGLDLLDGFLCEYRLPLSLQDINELEAATLLILLLDATKGDYVQEVAAADYLSYLGRPMLVCYSKMDLVPVETRLIHGQARWRGAEIMPLTTTQPDTVRELLVPAVLVVLPEHSLALARHLPLFRKIVADRLIERAANVNATYASASGLAETVPLLRVPLGEDDSQVLSINQAAMAYRLGIAYGRPLNWHEQQEEIRAAVDIGEVWRKLARRVVGAIPLWGLSSKVSLAYGGTVVTGRAIQQWLETGQPLSSEAVDEACREVAAQSRTIGDELVAKARDALPKPPAVGARRRMRSLITRSGLLSRRSKPRCPACHRVNPPDAAFCAYCGTSLSDSADASGGQAGGE
jgi:uncharacterized protein (DUF697 family)